MKAATKQSPIQRPISPARWARMSPKSRLLAIAKDVLAQLDTKRFRPTRGVYLRGRAMSFLSKFNNPKEVRQRLLTDDKAKSCQACAIGSMWLSRIRLADGVTGNEVTDWDEVRYEIGRNESEQIERAFESSYSRAESLVGFASRPWGARQIECEYRFGALYKSPTARLRAIMENIVDNKGVFKPEQAFTK